MMNSVPSSLWGNLLICVKYTFGTCAILLIIGTAMLSIDRAATWAHSPPYVGNNENVAIALAYLATGVSLLVAVFDIIKNFVIMLRTPRE